MNNALMSKAEEAMRAVHAATGGRTTIKIVSMSRSGNLVFRDCFDVQVTHGCARPACTMCVSLEQACRKVLEIADKLLAPAQVAK